jgi:hypothetical protein
LDLASVRLVVVSASVSTLVRDLAPAMDSPQVRDWLQVMDLALASARFQESASVCRR